MAGAVEAGIQRVASVGSQIGASMETAGHHAQALLLDQFGGPVGMKIGGLLYLIGIIGALITISSGGSYRFGIWLLLGPPLFFFLVNVRSPSEGADWRFGTRLHAQSEVQKGVRGLFDTDIGKVSLFFKGWNALVSTIVQGLVEVVGVTDGSSDLDFLNKSERYFSVYATKTIDPKLSGFINVTLINRCADYIGNRKKLADPTLEESLKAGARKIDAEHGGRNVVVNLSENTWLGDWFQAVGLTEEVGKKTTFTCPELWDLSVKAFKKLEARKIVELLANSNLPPGLTQKEAMDRLLVKFGMTTGNEAVISEQNAAGTAPGGNAQDDLRLTTLINELSVRLLFNEMAKLDPNLAALDMNEHQEAVRQGGERLGEDTSRALRMLQGSDEYQYKGELLIGALTLPYIQGCVLYFLAVAFPFFALAMLVPGRHTAFMLWMGLWLWAKLWDFGFAVVMMIDNMLYALMPHGSPMTDEAIKDPGVALRTLMQVDPTYSAATYYNIVACCLLSIPFVTGFLVHRGGQGAVDAVQGSFREFPVKFGTSTAAYKRAMMAQQDLRKAHLHTWNEFQTHAMAIAATDKNYQYHMRMRSALEAVRENLPGFIKMAENNKLGSAFPLLSRVQQEQIGSLLMSTATTGSKKGFLDARIEAENVRAKAQITKSLQSYAFKVSNSKYMRELAGEAILNRFNSHDFRRDYPTAPIINRMIAETYRPDGAAKDAVMNQLWQAWSGNK